MGQPRPLLFIFLISSFYMRLTTHKLESNCTFPYLTKFASSPGASRQQEGVLGRSHWCLTGSSANENAIDAVNLRHDVRFAGHEWLSKAATLSWLKAKSYNCTRMKNEMCQRIKESTIAVIAIGTIFCVESERDYDKFLKQGKLELQIMNWELIFARETRTPDAGIEPTSLTWLEVARTKGEGCSQ